MVASRIGVLGRGLLPAGEPVLRGDDLGVLRGDGLFETMHLRDGRPWLCREHLARLRAGAAAVELTVPADEALVELLDEVAAGWPAEVEGALRLVCTRGPEGGGPPTVYATLAAVPPAARQARRDGVGVATLSLGVPAEARPELDWLPVGIKSTSYGASSAARRWAARAGVDDVLWVSSDGYALEGPTANLVWLAGDTLCTVPAGRTGILPGTTVAWLLAHAVEVGWAAAERMVTTTGLRDADGVWLTSSVRGLVPVHTLDGVPLRRNPRTRALQDLLGFPHP
ncbi:4-amino-4-deoxychorismate lyase [Micromonospora phaseoli]|uniref:4-amino-4-deoxychorismate lyase n=1 Tax=Micromonospora phaseoli TaxID=1144548 RepID=A0A1H7DGB2_9ACTN|nr:aminotransferase class IV [Micromonospora phaseoli]PZW02288.1 4-amino-4-deoxychorismate lyase [Micromonospora phaseoli]GIJ75708.1 4-amino-4-deoxychorismate lyase [Micromonospora phaseoli]SEK00829.1 4-amino-4-deoxychorismate lyase [Micromonospora phaseoli]